MRSKSAPGSSRPTSRLTSLVVLPLWARLALGFPVVLLGALYVIAAFIGPSPWLRIVLRCGPVLPVALWTLWFDRARPWQNEPPLRRAVGRIALLLAVMVFAFLLLGLGLNWLYDPRRIV